MTRRASSAFLVLLLSSCSGPSTTERALAPSTPTTPAPPSGTSVSPPERAPGTTTEQWPFQAWDRAEALTFNEFGRRRGVPLRVYQEDGWSEHIGKRKPIDHELTTEAMALVRATEGGLEVSKCPFPRHAVVLYLGDRPVASINVCFECGDILLWPRWRTEPDWEGMDDAQWAAHQRQMEARMAVYERVFPKWQSFFRDRVGFPLTGFRNPQRQDFGL